MSDVRRPKCGQCGGRIGECDCLDVGSILTKAYEEIKSELFKEDTMNDDMEIMREFENIVSPTGEAIEAWLPDAVRRENDRAIAKVLEYLCKNVNDDSKRWIERKILPKYSPSPRYCKHMNGAINRGYIHIKEFLDHKKYVIKDIAGTDHYYPIDRCPWCPDGDNCTGDKK